MSTLERAVVIAAEGHAGMTDKAGAPYILHPLRVMLAMTSRNDQIVGVLHDVVEDCGGEDRGGWTLDKIRDEGFSAEVVEALDSVTKREDEDYCSFVRRAAANPIGRRIKMADLKDNSDLTRIREPQQRDLDRIEKYRDAINIIEQMDEVGTIHRT
jgi:(p)ppGpp synthase/HD superfamily hydrolase